MRVDRSARRSAASADPSAGGVFGSSGVSVVPHCRVIDWQGPFDGASLQAFKGCVTQLNNADRDMALNKIQDVRNARLSVQRAVSSLRRKGSKESSTQRTLLRYQDKLKNVESELNGILNGKYPRRLLMMNSPGGYVYTMTGLIPYLGKNLDVYGGQMIASAGGVAFVSGKGRRIMPESGGQMGIHSVQAGAQGSLRDVEFAVRSMKETNRFMEKKYVRGSKGKLTAKKFREWIADASTSPAGMKWLTGKQAMQYGLCDGLCRNPVKLMDSYRPQPIDPLLGQVNSFLERKGLAPPPKDTPSQNPAR